MVYLSWYAMDAGMNWMSGTSFMGSGCTFARSAEWKGRAWKMGSNDERVGVRHSDFYRLVRFEAERTLLRNAVFAGIPREQILKMLSGQNVVKFAGDKVIFDIDQDDLEMSIALLMDMKDFFSGDQAKAMEGQKETVKALETAIETMQVFWCEKFGQAYRDEEE